MATKMTLDDLDLLAKFIRDTMEFCDNNSLFTKITLRNIARVLEKDNPFFVTPKTKIDRAKHLLNSDTNYSPRYKSIIECPPPNSHNDKYYKDTVERYKKFKEICETQYTDIPLHVNDVGIDKLASSIVHWRLKIKK